MKKNLFLFLFYFLSAALLYPFLKYYIDSADPLQYITNAKSYADGRFYNAVNSFWSPLISWLLVPFIKIGIEPVFAFKILQIIIGFFTLLLIFYFVDRSNSAPWIRTSLKTACVPLVISYGFLFSTPDLLLLTFYLLFVRLLKNNRSPLFPGICGAAMYLTKGFGFAFFIVAAAIAFFYKFLTKEITGKKLATSLLKAYSIFFLLSAPWIYLVSAKEQRIIFSSAGINARNLINPEINPDPFDDIHYHFEKGVLSEPPPYATSAWIYPHYLTESAWSPFSSSEDFLHYLKMIWRNILSVGSFHFGADAGMILMLTLVLLFALRQADLKRILRENVFLLIACIVCTGLYVLLVTIHRYVWINDIAIIILFGIAVQKLFEWKRWAGFISAALFIFFLLYSPLRSIIQTINVYKDVYVISHELKNKYDFRGNIVSLTDDFPDKNHRLSHLVAYYTGAWYYGMAGEHNAGELEEKKIDFMLDWNYAANNWPQKNNFAEEVAAFPGIGLTVFKINRITLQTD